MTKPSLLILIVFTVFASACSTSTHPAPQQPAVPRFSREAEAELERSRLKRTKEDAEAFDLLTGKMDEYQNLFVICESISETEETRQLKATCAERLKTLKQELIDLSGRLQDQE